jgi:hypothetical protein
MPIKDRGQPSTSLRCFLAGESRSHEFHLHKTIDRLETDTVYPIVRFEEHIETLFKLRNARTIQALLLLRSG